MKSKRKRKISETLSQFHKINLIVNNLVPGKGAQNLTRSQAHRGCSID